MRTAPTALWILGITACLLCLVPGCKESSPPSAAAPRPVRIVEAGQGDGRLLTLSGTLAANASAKISVQASGRIIALPISEGGQVAKGDILLRLDERDFPERVKAAAAKLTQATTEFNRSKELLKSGVVSQSNYDKIEAALEAARAELAANRKALEDRTLIAPFNGLVAKVLVDSQETVNAGQSILILQDLTRLKVTVDVPETLIAQATPGLTLAERSERIRPEVVVSALPGRSWPCQLVEMANQPDPNTRTFQCTFAFIPPTNAMLLPGMSAGVRGRESAVSGRLSVPISALIGEDDGSAGLWIADPATLAVHQRTVTLGQPHNQRVDIISGLEAGELVVETGVELLQEGQVVRRLDH